MSETSVTVEGLLKVFDVPEREAGLVAATKGLVRRKTRAVRAVDEISFAISPGEVVGFLGPNGAGKTTTLKMLSGLLYPSGGEARVLGFVPSKRQRAFLSRITLVMGNRNQLQWDLPALDSYELNRAIYRIPRDQFGPTRDELIELLEIGDLVRKPVRQLSLGERMKAEIVGALLHRPQVLFLDEPTIGLDVTMQKRIRDLRRRLQRALRRDGPPDEPLHGRRRGALQARRRHPPRPDPVRRGARRPRGSIRRLQDDQSCAGERACATCRATARSSTSTAIWITLRVPKADTSSVTARLLTEEQVLDLNVEDPPIEDVIELVFAQERPE